MNVKEGGSKRGKELVSSLFLGKGEASWEKESINLGFVDRI